MFVASNNHEELLVRAFLPKQMQERVIYLLADPKRRRKFTEKLAHFNNFDPRFAKPLPGIVAHTASEIVSLLRSKGAGDTAHIISEVRSIDGHNMSLVEAMAEVWGNQLGSIISCVPGRLAFFRGEELKSELVLERT